MYVPLKIGKEMYKAAWSVDTIVLPEYRNKGIGKQLQTKSAENHQIFMSIRSSEVNRKIKESFGSIPLTHVSCFRRWIKVNRYNFRNAVKNRMVKSNYFNKKWLDYFRALNLDEILVHIINASLATKNRIAHKVNIENSVKISEVDYFKDNIDEFWDNIKGQFDFIVTRDKKYLNWRYVSQPHMNYRKFIAKRNSKICGYIVLRKAKPPESNVGIISDMISIPQDRQTLRQLIQFALKFFSNDVEAIKCPTSVHEIKLILKELSFSKEQENPFIFFSTDSYLMDKIKNKNLSYYFGMGDHDWDQYPLEKLKYQFSIFHLDTIPGMRKLLKSIFKAIFL